MKSSSIAKELSALLAPFGELGCVGGKLYLGSMFYLDFGSMFIGSSRSGERIEIGEMTISVRDVAWWLYREGSLVVSAEEVSADRFEQVLRDVVGGVVEVGEQPNEERLEIQLGAHHKIVVDLMNIWETNSNILEFALPDGRIASVDELGVFVADDGRDEQRAKHWCTSPRRN